MILTPIGLVLDLADRIRDITEDLRLEESDGNHALRAPRVWAQNLPEKLYDDKVDVADYPFILVMLGGGNGVVDDRMTCSVAVLVGAYDDGQPLPGNPDEVRDRQGWVAPAAIIWRIIASLVEKPTIGPYRLNLEQLAWEMPTQEQPEPLWYGIINMQWTVPLPERHFNLENTDSRAPKPCNAALEDNIRTFLEGGA